MLHKTRPLLIAVYRRKELMPYLLLDNEEHRDNSALFVCRMRELAISSVSCRLSCNLRVLGVVSDLVNSVLVRYIIGKYIG